MNRGFDILGVTAMKLSKYIRKTKSMCFLNFQITRWHTFFKYAQGIMKSFNFYYKFEINDILKMY